jgi:hypothetical protein
MFAAAAAFAAHGQTQVFVPGAVSGNFGNPSDEINPLVAALTVSGPGTITVTYVSGLVCWAGPSNCTGPDGTYCSWCPLQQWPLQESRGIGLTKTHKVGALMGVFVPACKVNSPGFQAIDGTKNNAQLGIMPGGLFFVGTGKTFPVSEAGTLYLGINDTIVSDNSGGFNVDVSVQ